MTTKKYITCPGCVWGADPEFFFEQEGQIVGSEMILPEEGLTKSYVKNEGGSPNMASTYGSGRIVRDGVQAEFNPLANNAGCRANFGNELVGCFEFLKEHLRVKHPKVKLSMEPLIELDKSEMDKLSDKSKILGCAPSLNLYDRDATPGVDGNVYLKRSAGGHLHFGLDETIKNLPNYAERIVAALDVMVGNTCVLIDQHPSNRERRKVYGRAGEYRVPSHGVEYRTLSNFWIRAYPLLSMILGLSRYALATVYTSSICPRRYDYALAKYVKDGDVTFNAEKELFKNIDQKAIVRAINENDYSLAFQNWLPVREFLMTHVRSGISGGLGPDYMPKFDHFLEKIRTDGLEYWFKDDPLTSWTSNGDGHCSGMETFLTRNVNQDMLKKEERKVA